MGQIFRKTDFRKYVTVEKLRDIPFIVPFFDVFREAYGPYFTEWWFQHADDEAFTVREEGHLVAFLKLKLEDEWENYNDITPLFHIGKRLKICSLKIDSSCSLHGLSDYFMQIVFSRAVEAHVDEIYGTVAVGYPATSAVERYLEKWGFRKSGSKLSHGIREEVYVNASPAEWSKALFEVEVPFFNL